tara:strand:- start:41 stop:343 length:303 start_codon:yes stop_codon:yes gene_type:complete
MANLAFSNKEPWEKAHAAMKTHILDQTDGAFAIKQEGGAICVYSEGSDEIPEGSEGYMKNPPSAYKEGAILPVRFMGWRMVYFTIPHGFLQYMWKKEGKK